MSPPELKLFLFTANAVVARGAEEAGVASVIVDWENQGKATRQQTFDTQINRDTVADLDRIVRAVGIPVTVRVNGGEAGLEELEVALDHGARVIMYPMARSAAEVETFLQRVNGRAQTLVQIETQRLVDDVAGLKYLGWDYAFIGLNDLMISRGGNWLWEPLLDGTVETIFEQLPARKVGLGGVTVIGGGRPLPFTELLRELARLGCSLSFLRRTFHREIRGPDFSTELAAVQAAWQAALARGASAIQEDACEFRARLAQLKPAALSSLSGIRLAS